MKLHHRNFSAQSSLTLQLVPSYRDASWGMKSLSTLSKTRFLWFLTCLDIINTRTLVLHTVYTGHQGTSPRDDITHSSVGCVSGGCLECECVCVWVCVCVCACARARAWIDQDSEFRVCSVLGPRGWGWNALNTSGSRKIAAWWWLATGQMLPVPMLYPVEFTEGPTRDCWQRHGVHRAGAGRLNR